MAQSIKMGYILVLEPKIGLKWPIFSIRPLKLAFLTSNWPFRPLKPTFLSSKIPPIYLDTIPMVYFMKMGHGWVLATEIGL